VRVLRGYQVKSAFAPAEGYRYDGLYYVARYWEGSDAGFKVGIDIPLCPVAATLTNFNNLHLFTLLREGV